MENAETDCRAVLAKLYLYLDGEIDAVDCGAFERHLRECGPCLQVADFERELKMVIRRKCSGEAVPPGLAERLRARLRGVL